MTTTALAGRTDYEAREWAADHGRTAAIAVGYQLLARHVNACGTEDLELLGLREIPDPRPQMWPVTGGTDDDRRARIDAWAKRHGTTAGPDEDGGTYRAVLSFGLVKVIAYMIPDRTMDERLAAIYSAARGEAAA